MLNGWFTIVAQAVNFLILVWLLKRFLYKPILHAIDEREKGIATQLAKAEAKMAEAQKERDDFEHKNEAFDEERASLLKEATDKASAERQRILDEAREDAASLRAKRQDALRDEQRNLNQAIIHWTQKQVFAITRKTLADLATTSLEERMGEVFVRRVRGLSGESKEQLATAFESSNRTVSVHSAFDLPAALQTAIDCAIKETFAPDALVQFETAPELVSGIELSVHGQKVAWSIADYLATLEKSAVALLHVDARSDSEPDSKVKLETKAEAKTDAESKAKPDLEPVSSAPKGTQ